VRPAGSSGLRAQRKGIFVGAQEAIAAGHLLGERGDQALAIDRLAKGGLDTSQ
jgi:hypothetical protein